MVEVVDVRLTAQLVDEELCSVALSVKHLCAYSHVVRGERVDVIATVAGEVYFVAPNVLLSAPGSCDIATAARALSLAAARVASCNPYTLRPTERRDAVLQMTPPRLLGVELRARVRLGDVIRAMAGMQPERDQRGKFVIAGDLAGRRVWVDESGLHAVVRGEAASDPESACEALAEEMRDFLVHAN
jgi:hypothetical protein